MPKRKFSKNYLDNLTEEITTAINTLNSRLTNIENVVSAYVQWRRHDKRFKKYIKKQYEKNSNSPSV
mgnify:FL=1|jgi:hypothetical protein